MNRILINCSFVSNSLVNYKLIGGGGHRTYQTLINKYQNNDNNRNMKKLV